MTVSLIAMVIGANGSLELDTCRQLAERGYRVVLTAGCETEGRAAVDGEEGARGIVWAATLPDDGASGGFFRHGEPIAWLPDWGIWHPIFRIPLADQDVFFVPSPGHSCLGPIPGE